MNHYGFPIQSPDEVESPLLTTVSLLNNSGTFLNQKILQVPTSYPTNQSIIHITPRNYQSVQYIRNIQVFSGLNFYAANRITAGPEGNLYIGKSDSLRFQKYNLNGIITDTIRAIYTPVPFTDAHWDSLSEERDADSFVTAINEVGRPDFWPAFQDFFVDDSERIWVQLLGPGNSVQPWWVFNSEGEPQWEFELPSDITLYQVQNGHAYGLSQPEGGLPSIVRYEVGAL